MNYESKWKLAFIEANRKRGNEIDEIKFSRETERDVRELECGINYAKGSLILGKRAIVFVSPYENQIDKDTGSLVIPIGFDPEVVQEYRDQINPYNTEEGFGGMLGSKDDKIAVVSPLEYLLVWRAPLIRRNSRLTPSQWSDKQVDYDSSGTIDAAVIKSKRDLTGKIGVDLEDKLLIQNRSNTEFHLAGSGKEAIGDVMKALYENGFTKIFPIPNACLYGESEIDADIKERERALNQLVVDVHRDYLKRKMSDTTIIEPESDLEDTTFILSNSQN